MSKLFSNYDISQHVISGLSKSNFVTPTDIQEKTIELALSGADIIGSSQTGTGKTLAFLIPIINHLINHQQSTALILEPTRELAKQVINTFLSIYQKDFNIKSLVLIGGESYIRQKHLIKKYNPRLIIGTPGRIIDHIERKNIQFDNCHYLVLDETDRMLDIGFYDQIERILKFLNQDRQTFMFSATFPEKIEFLAQKYMKSPHKIFVQEDQKTNVIANNLKVTNIDVEDNNKYNELLKHIDNQKFFIVFVKTKAKAEELFKKLKHDRYNVGAIHGDLTHRFRENIIKNYREKKYNILIGTDVIARGIDIPHIQCVINYDLPYAPEDYIHRLGRTARNGANGFAINFINQDDYKKRWKSIQKLLYPEKYKNEKTNKQHYCRNTKRFNRRKPIKIE